MASLTATGIAAQGSWVRALAIDLLNATSGESDWWEQAAHATPGAWEVFLRTERCSVPVAQRLETLGLLRALPDKVQELLEKRRRIESLRVLRARAQLAELGGVASERGWAVIVLKGGRAITRESNIVLDLADLDVLVPVDTVGAVSSWLDANAVTKGHSSPGHVASRYIEGGLPIEVHHAIDANGAPGGSQVWAGAEPLAPGLLGLTPVEHAWHVLYHATASHLSRRGRLRDVVLIADALQECSLEEQQALHRRAKEHRHAAPLGWHLDMAGAVVNGDPVVDRFASVAFTRYAMYTIMRRARWRGLLEAYQLVDWVCAVRAGRAERRMLWARALEPSSEVSPYRIVRWVERLSPTVGLLWRRTVRLGHRVVLRALAWPMALKIERGWQRASLC